MSKGGGQGSFAQMQEPGMSMDMGGFGGGGPQPQPFDAGLLIPEDNRQGMPSLPPQGGLSDNITGFIPGGGNSSTRINDVIGGDGLLYQLQPINQPIASPQPQPQPIGDPSNPQLQELRPLPQPGGFGGAMRRFNNLSAGDRERLGDLGIDDIFGSGAQRVTNVQTQGPESMPRLEEQMRMNEVSGPARPDPLDGVDLNRFSGGLGSKGGRSNPYQTDGIVPPDMGGGRVYAGGTPNFDERTGQYRRQPFMPRSLPFPMPRPPRMPPRQPPRMPGRNTQFQMPFFGSPYGQMNPYAGQFSGYGVPSNMFSFAQPHYQPYVPQAYTPPPPVMQLPPDQGNQAFSGGFGNQGIGGFGRYNLGLARRQFGGR